MASNDIPKEIDDEAQRLAEKMFPRAEAYMKKREALRQRGIVLYKEAILIGYKLAMK